MNILIIEDEPILATTLECLIKQLMPESFIHKTTGVADSISFIEANNDIDFIFADIQLADGKVFSVLDNVQTSANVIFTTSFNQYAIRAFDYNCVNYLLKPVTSEALALAFDKCRKIHSFKHKTLDMNIEFRQKLILNVDQDIVIVSVANIVYIYTEYGVTRVYLNDGNWATANVSLLQLYASLDPNMFFRANRQTIVNVEYIDRIAYIQSREFRIHLHPPFDDVDIFITPNRKKELISLLKK